jgi:arsenite methyltransferase
MRRLPAAQSCIYEQGEVQQILGETLRPGGLGLTQKALDACTLPLNSRVLDVGCGTGLTVQYLQASGYRAAGVDLSQVLLNQALQRNPALALVQGNAAHLSLASGLFDAILVECSLSEFPAAGPVLDEFQRLLGSNGSLIVSDIYARNPDGLAALEWLPSACCFSRAWVQADLLALLNRHGFEVRSWEDHSEALKPVAGRMIASPAVMAQLQGPENRTGMDALDLQIAIAKARPGYFLLTAQKR